MPPEALTGAGLMQEDSTKVVLFAIAANTVVMVVKLVAWVSSGARPRSSTLRPAHAVATGSAALGAEVLHSLADIANQALLFVGIRQSRHDPTTDLAVVSRSPPPAVRPPPRIPTAFPMSATYGHWCPPSAASSSAASLRCALPPWPALATPRARPAMTRQAWSACRLETGAGA